MKKIIYNSLEDEQLYNAVKSTPECWFETPLPDSELRPQFNRKLLVYAFNHPKDELYLSVVQELRWKDSDEVYKTIQIPMWHITADNKENLLREDGSQMTATEYDTDEFGEIIEDTGVEIEIKENSVKYVRFLEKNRIMYIDQIICAFFSQYIEKYQTEIDDV